MTLNHKQPNFALFGLDRTRSQSFTVRKDGLRLIWPEVHLSLCGQIGTVTAMNPIANLSKLANNQTIAKACKSPSFPLQEICMRVITATEAKNRLGEALSFDDDESLMIEKNGKEAVMAFSASTGRRMVLSAYSQGNISRSTAMNLLGLEWYGDLLVALSQANVPKPSLPADERSRMKRYAVHVLGGS